jgi:hypothetical protein
LKRDKQADKFRNPSDWIPLVPEAIRGNFNWPTAKEREHWRSIRDSVCLASNSPPQQVGNVWDFYSVFGAVETGEYDLIACEMTAVENAEIRIDPWAYPYGGVGPFVALAEAYGFKVLGLNSYGKYESREELLKHQGR